MESLESQITSLDQRLNLALVEKLNEEIQNIKVRLQILEKDNTTLINLSNSEKEWLDGRSKSSKR